MAPPGSEGETAEPITGVQNQHSPRAGNRKDMTKGGSDSRRVSVGQDTETGSQEGGHEGHHERRPVSLTDVQGSALGAFRRGAKEKVMALYVCKLAWEMLLGCNKDVVVKLEGYRFALITLSANVCKILSSFSRPIHGMDDIHVSFLARRQILVIRGADGRSYMLFHKSWQRFAPFLDTIKEQQTFVVHFEELKELYGNPKIGVANKGRTVQCKSCSNLGAEGLLKSECGAAQCGTYEDIVKASATGGYHKGQLNTGVDDGRKGSNDSKGSAKNDNDLVPRSGFLSHSSPNREATRRAGRQQADRQQGADQSSPSGQPGQSPQDTQLTTPSPGAEAYPQPGTSHSSQPGSGFGVTGAVGGVESSSTEQLKFPTQESQESQQAAAAFSAIFPYQSRRPGPREQGLGQAVAGAARSAPKSNAPRYPRYADAAKNDNDLVPRSGFSSHSSPNREATRRAGRQQADRQQGADQSSPSGQPGQSSQDTQLTTPSPGAEAYQQPGTSHSSQPVSGFGVTGAVRGSELNYPAHKGKWSKKTRAAFRAIFANQTKWPGPRGAPRYPRYGDATVRWMSFKSWPERAQQRPEALVTYGFFYTGHIDHVRCFMCGIGLKEWGSDDMPLLEHIKHSPDCAFLLHLPRPILLDACKTNLLPGRTQHQEARTQVGGTNVEDSSSIPAPQKTSSSPQFSSMYDRLSAYSRRSEDLVQTPMQLAEAGVYYTGFEDVVRCYGCDGGLQRWDPNDAPWVEHSQRVTTATSNDEKVLGASPFQLSVDPEVGPTDSVLAAIEDLSTDQNDPGYLQYENLRLKNIVKCIICQVRNTNVLFLPCTHHRVCQECSLDLHQCPECRREIKSKVKTYTS